MRSASLLGALALAALIGSAGLARTEPYDAVIRQDTDVRSGHGDGAMFYPTNHLHAGDRVRVVKEEDGGWLAIVPPSGSFSLDSQGSPGHEYPAAAAHHDGQRGRRRPHRQPDHEPAARRRQARAARHGRLPPTQAQ